MRAILGEVYLSSSQSKDKPFTAFASGGGVVVESVHSIESVATSYGLHKVFEGITVGGMPTESESQDPLKLRAALGRATEELESGTSCDNVAALLRGRVVHICPESVRR